MPMTEQVRLVYGDVTDALVHAAHDARQAALDVETTGLDWRTAELATVQVAAPGGPTEVVRIERDPPERLLALLENADVQKIFHHALFDLRFVAARWAVEPAAIACTKVAAKILQGLHPETPTSLKPLLERFLGIAIDKELQCSNWQGELSAEQVAYAANDVIFLDKLLRVIRVELDRENLGELVARHFDFIPWRLKADLLGLGDPFTY